MKILFMAALIGMWATGAIAHSPLTGTTPANAAILTAAPSEITLTFKGKIRLTRLTLALDSGSKINLDLSGHKGFIPDYAVPMQPMGTGVYTIDWRGLGIDGHALNGTFSFTVE